MKKKEEVRHKLILCVLNSHIENMKGDSLLSQLIMRYWFNKYYFFLMSLYLKNSSINLKIPKERSLL